MRRMTTALIAAALLCLSVATTIEGATAQAALSCPPTVGQAELWEEQSGEIERPAYEDGQWALSCIYSQDGYDAGGAFVYWYEKPNPYPYCPVELTALGPVVSSSKAAAASIRETTNNDDGTYPNEQVLTGVAQSLLAAAEARAAPCGTNTPPPSPSASPSPSPSASPSPSPSTTCVVTGTVKDHLGEPVPGLRVQLAGPGLSIETTSSEAGTFEFRDIKARAPALDPATDQVFLILYLEAPGRYKFFYKTEEVLARTQAFSVASGADCKKDLTHDTSYAERVPNSPPHWTSLWSMESQLQKAFNFVELVVFDTLDYLPLKITTFCDSSVTSDCDGAKGAYYTGSSPGREGTAPEIVLETRESTSKASVVDDTIYHEFGHHTQSDLQGNLQAFSPGRKAHRGYYENDSSNDSYIEGFASFFAMMVTKHWDGDEAVPRFRFANGSSEQIENDLPAWAANGLREELALAGLLLDFEDGSSDYLEGNPPVVKADDVVYKELKSQSGARIIVGKIKTLRRGAMALLFIELLDGDGKRVRAIPIWIDGTQEALRDGTGVVFWAVVPKENNYKTIRITGLKERNNDDDPIDVDLDDLWYTITRGSSGLPKPGKPSGFQHIFDVNDLYSVLQDAYGGGDEDGNDIDDVDQVFIAHGFYADQNGNRTYDQNERIGLTSHPPIDAAGQPAGPSRLRFDLQNLPEQMATVDTGAADASVIAFVNYPEDRAAQSYSYVAERDDEGKFPVVVPPEGSGATVTLLAVADGYLPDVVAEVDADDFWADAAQHPGESFLSYDVELEEGEVTLEDGGGSGGGLLLLAGGALIAAAAALLLWRRRAASGQPA